MLSADNLIRSTQNSTQFRWMSRIMNRKPPWKQRFSGGGSFGEPGGIRTHDLLIRSQTLYPAELRARVPHSLVPYYYTSFPRICQRLFFGKLR